MHRTPSFRARPWIYGALLLTVLVRGFMLVEKPFWRDEAWVARLVEMPLRTSLAEPRTVPIGFLAAAQITAKLPIVPEISFRLLPLLSGLAVVPLLGLLAAALGASAQIAVAVLWIAAGMPALVYYSRELKSYGLDAFFAALVPLLALQLFGRAAGPRLLGGHAAGALLIAALLLAPWVSFGAMFAILAVLAWGWLAWWRDAAPATRRWWMLANASYATSFVLAYRVTVATQVANPRLWQVWRGKLLEDVSPSLLTRTLTAMERYAGICTTYFFPGVWKIALPLVLLGLFVWPRAWRRTVAWLLLGSGGLTVVAAVADRYLIATGRLLLFAAPPLVLYAAAGIDAVARRLCAARAASFTVAGAAACGLLWSGIAVAHRVDYENNFDTYFLCDIVHDVPALLDAAGIAIGPAEPVYIAQYASRPFAFYARGRFADATVCKEPCDFDGVTNAWLAALHGRGWIMLAADERTRIADLLPAYGATYRLRLAARGAELWEIQRPDASVAPPSDAPNPAP